MLESPCTMPKVTLQDAHKTCRFVHFVFSSLARKDLRRKSLADLVSIFSLRLLQLQMKVGVGRWVQEINFAWNQP